MVSLLKRAVCSTCGRRHNFGLVQGDVEAGREYGYFCPESGKMAKIQAPEAGESARSLPQGAILLMAGFGKDSEQRKAA